MVENKQTQTDENSLENARYPFWFAQFVSV
ncbi:hypothetical protein WS74_1075 [Weissella ceti]|uniref:Uncharacterized protein n=1 Tax=Weissella ceti TaxID=759620 RepID=A0A088GHA6_9LACO|nr:hypothetical protein WS74_1075 [Weissella ceti]